MLRGVGPGNVRSYYGACKEFVVCMFFFKCALYNFQKQFLGLSDEASSNSRCVPKLFVMVAFSTKLCLDENKVS